MFDKMQSYIKKEKMIEKDDLILLGLSGGPDSMCLFHLLMKYQKVVPFTLRVVHINHMLREEANAEALFVQAECEKYDILCDVISVDVESLSKKEKVSTEEAGRMARYQAFNRVLQIEEDLFDAEDKGDEKKRKGKIAIAHNKNDVAETVLFNLFRGSGLQGLTGISPVNGNIIRPILCLERYEIEEYVEREGISYCTDLSNEEDVYTRNRIRRHILPYAEREISEGVSEHIFETAEMAREAQEFILLAVDEAEKHTILKRNHKIFIKMEEFQNLHGTIKNELLRKTLFELSGKRKDITRKHINDLSDLFEKQVGKEISLPYQISASKTYDGIWIKNKEEDAFLYQTNRLEIGKRNDPVLGEITVTLMDAENLTEIPEKKCTKWFDYDRIIKYLVLRTRKPEDYFVINKKGNKKMVKDYMVNQKIPREDRDKKILIADGNHVVWIPGYRISETYKVTEKTKRVIKIQIGN